jgi:hypothetical protein
MLVVRTGAAPVTAIVKIKFGSASGKFYKTVCESMQILVTALNLRMDVRV